MHMCVHVCARVIYNPIYLSLSVSLSKPWHHFHTGTQYKVFTLSETLAQTHTHVTHPQTHTQLSEDVVDHELVNIGRYGAVGLT